jgi:Tfp pilus assembly protein FimV
MARTRVRWGRVATLALAVGLGAGVAGQASLSARADAPRAQTRPVSALVHEVRAGETIWSIARRLVGPRGDPRPVVDAVIAANHLHDAQIFAGQLLVVPSAG